MEIGDSRIVEAQVILKLGIGYPGSCPRYWLKAKGTSTFDAIEKLKNRVSKRKLSKLEIEALDMYLAQCAKEYQLTPTKPQRIPKKA